MQPSPASKIHRPPFTARILLRLACPTQQWADIEGDFLEVFHGVRTRSGVWAARARYSAEVAMYCVWRVRALLGNKRSRAPHRTTKRPASQAPQSGRWLSELIQDLRHALRLFARAPTFTATAVVILALGIGANTTMFTLIDVLFRQAPPGVERPEELVRLARNLGTHLTGSLGYPDYEYYRDENTVFDGVAAYSTNPIAVAVSETNGGTAQSNAWIVSGNYFDVLGVRPVVGRLLRDDDDRFGGAASVAVISEGLWRRTFDSDSSAIGSPVNLNGHSFVMVGVAPAAFRGLSPVVSQPDIYVPMHARPILEPGSGRLLERRDGYLAYWLRTVARLKPETTLQAADANLDVLNSRWTQEFASWIEATDPDTLRMAAWPLPQLDPRHSQRLSGLLQLLSAVVASVLLIAAANIAILLLARGAARRSEFALRAALGAGRKRVLQQLLTESLMLAMIGGSLGFVLSYWTADLASVLLPFSFNVNFVPDRSVLAMTLLVTAGTGVLFGVMPALHLSRTDLTNAIKSARQDSGRSRLRDALVVSQVGLSVLLVIGAGLFLRSLYAASDTDLGFGSGGKLFMEVRLANHGYDEDAGQAFLREVVDRLGAVPGVASVTATSRKPLRTMAFGDLRIPGEDEIRSAGFNLAAPRYFETMGIPLLAGREFSWQDGAGARPVMIVNQTMAERFWPGKNALGQTVQYENGVVYTVVGIAGNAQYHDIGNEMVPQLYLPTPQHSAFGNTVFALRTQGRASLVSQAAQGVLRSVDPNVAVFGVESFDDIVSDELARYRATAVLVSMFGVLALILAAVGLYGVQSYLVAQRTHEIGVRMALGALHHQVAGAIVRRGVVLACIGVVLGVGGALSLSRLVSSLLFDVSPRDPISLAVAPVLLLAVTTAASFVPAVRAARVNPVLALRNE